MQQASYIGLKLGFKGLNFQEHATEPEQDETHLARTAKSRVSAAVHPQSNLEDKIDEEEKESESIHSKTFLNREEENDSQNVSPIII